MTRSRIIRYQTRYGKVNDRSRDVSIYSRIYKRGFLKNREDVRDLRLELDAEAASLGFIPDFCLSLANPHREYFELAPANFCY